MIGIRRLTGFRLSPAGLAGFTTTQDSIADIAKKIAAAVLIDDGERL